MKNQKKVSTRNFYRGQVRYALIGPGCVWTLEQLPALSPNPGCRLQFAAGSAVPVHAESRCCFSAKYEMVSPSPTETLQS